MTSKLENSKRKIVKVLFVRGFLTDVRTVDSIDIYKSIRNYFIGMKEKASIQWFSYGPNDDLHEVYGKLVDRIKHEKPDILIGHSLGGLLVYHYLVETVFITKSVSIDRPMPRPVLLMPYLQPTPSRIYRLVRYVPSFIRKRLYIPSVFISRQPLLDIALSDYRIAQFDQIYQAEEFMTLNKKRLLQNLTSFKIKVLYATNETVSTIDEDIVDKLMQSGHLSMVQGTHDAHNTRREYGDFFEVLDETLEVLFSDLLSDTDT